MGTPSLQRLRFSKYGTLIPTIRGNIRRCTLKLQTDKIVFKKSPEQLINLKGKSNKTKNIALTLQHIKNEKKNSCSIKPTKFHWDKKKLLWEKRLRDSRTKTQHAAITAHTYPIEEYGIVLTKTVARFNVKLKHGKLTFPTYYV